MALQPAWEDGTVLDARLHMVAASGEAFPVIFRVGR
jgi:hypothetical protein